MPVQSPLYRWVKQCRRSLRIWIPIHTEFHWVSVQESHRMFNDYYMYDVAQLVFCCLLLPAWLRPKGFLLMCSSRKYPYFPTEGIGISWGVRGFVRPKYLKKCTKLNLNFQRVGGGGGGVLEKKSLL